MSGPLETARVDPSGGDLAQVWSGTVLLAFLRPVCICAEHKRSKTKPQAYGNTDTWPFSDVQI